MVSSKTQRCRRLLRLFLSPTLLWCSQVYQCTEPEPSAEPKKLRFMLLDRFLPSNVVCGSHLFKYSWHEDVSNTLGFTNINDTRNGLLLFKCVHSVSTIICEHEVLPYVG